MRECRVTLIDEREVGDDNSGRDVVVPGLGRFNSVVERRSCGKCFKDLCATLPWAILAVAAVQILIEYCFDRNFSFALSLRSGGVAISDEGEEDDSGGMAMREYLRYFSYMFAHESQSHLWSNVATGVTLAWFASASSSSRRSGIAGQMELLCVYLLSGFGGGVAFKAATASSSADVGLVGGSAGVFGLAALCIVDSVVDLVSILSPCSKIASYSSMSKSSNNSSSHLLILTARSLAAAVVIGFDLYSALSRHSVPSDVLAVHLGGLFAGAVVSVCLSLFRGARRCWAKGGGDGENNSYMGRRYVVSLLQKGTKGKSDVRISVGGEDCCCMFSQDV